MIAHCLSALILLTGDAIGGSNPAPGSIMLVVPLVRN